MTKWAKFKPVIKTGNKKIKEFILKNRKVILLIFGGIILVEILVQIFWPSNYTLLKSKIGENGVGIISKEEANSKIKDTFSSSKIQFKTSLSSFELSGKAILEAGEYQEDNSASSSEVYPLPWRFLPFSILFFEQDLKFGNINFNQEKLKDFSEQEISAKLNKEAHSAEFIIEGEKVSIKKSENGIKVSSGKIEEQIRKNKFEISKNEITIEGEEIEPEIRTQDYEKVKIDAEAAIKRAIYFVLNGEKISTSVEQRASLLSVVRNQQGEYVLELKDDALTQLYEPINKKVYVAPGETTVYLTNGEETSRKAGANGLGVDYATYKKGIEEKMLRNGNSLEINLATKVIEPAVKYEHNFTKTNEGIQAYLNHVSSEGSITVAYQKLSGDFSGAAAGGDKTMVVASTYKLFIAQFIMNKIDAGQLSWNSPVLGTTVEKCFQSMIVNSANNCAEHWISTYGYQSINNYLNSMGYGSVFGNGEAKTTANSLRKMLLNLYYGNGFSAANRSKLLDLMRAQVYRNGIPKGSSGSVADKVGFLNGVLNDAGIVFSSNGNYILVVMTDGQSWGKIAEITRKIEELSN
ncbi:MAG: serine hydrolase [bacterium]|nr:serine hydrolase [bacterium]